METHNKLILKHLKQGRSITAMEALKLWGCMRLSARIFDLREAGHNIKTTRIEVNGKIIAEYRLVGVEPESKVKSIFRKIGLFSLLLLTLSCTKSELLEVEEPTIVGCWQSDIPFTMMIFKENVMLMSGAVGSGQHYYYYHNNRITTVENRLIKQIYLVDKLTDDELIISYGERGIRFTRCE